ncbi:glycosyltransferase involved in cell wall biosynthesis [Breznakia sp. PF5-3]|uniref:glycosyltransferase n=1 Tax=unclassified Breznakia TaxID=2623764 RepID=UPI00240534FD|nr:MULTISPECIES: glycosyltransferase [unclassified Breznakia]MDF9824979.1 glycosyltransferase involved in cell wall biosynthesis [Breznakia sp. PM6-1]MDF9835828.1 glycosyltransferase involved in cell wall biosynthesis [Breznakia sp. PF5-3]MDF9836920.1 glycosyltransferase involved in cell wall biosynthesis [Breznakia sp. PFB2-8]MDF9859866.1 glycosyltransferase involved in cell wall biosynthesis [Breznakia sp. PH5-24]
MKITIFALHLGFGGVEKYVITIANMLCKKYEVEIVSTYKVLESPSFPVDKRIRISYLIEDLKPNKEKFKKAIHSKKFLSIVREGFVSLKILILRKKRNIQAIKKCKADVIISTRIFHNKLIQKYAAKNIIKIATEHNHHNNDKKYIDKLVHSCNHFDYMLPISKELTTFYQKYLENVEVRYIPFCIDEPKDLPLTKNDESKMTFISVGRISKEKGVLDLIDIFYEIWQKIPDAFLHIVGDGALMSLVKNKVKEYKLEDYVCIHGYLYKDQINNLYSLSNVFLMTSFTESFGFVLLEAMSFGLPCIAFDSAQGANEIIKNGINGYLIKNRNKAVYVKTAIDLVENKKQLEDMNENARFRAMDFSCENTEKEWLHLMSEIEDTKL